MHLHIVLMSQVIAYIQSFAISCISSVRNNTHSIANIYIPQCPFFFGSGDFHWHLLRMDFTFQRLVYNLRAGYFNRQSIELAV